MASFCQNGIGALIKTKSAERIIAPIAAQVSHLIILSEWRDIDDENFSDLEPAAKEVAKATEELVRAAKRFVEDSDDGQLKSEMGLALEFAAVSGKGILMAAQKLSIQPALREHRNELVTSAQNVLQGTMQILLTADDVEVRKIIQSTRWLLDCLVLLESAGDMSALLAAFREFSEALLLLNNLAGGRLQELSDPVHQQRLNRALETLKKCVPSLHTAMHACMKHPQAEQAKAAKTYVAEQTVAAVMDIVGLLTGGPADHEEGRGGQFAERLQQLQDLASKAKHSSIAHSNLDSLVEAVACHCMLVAAHTSKEKLGRRLVRSCQLLLQLRAQLSDRGKGWASWSDRPQQPMEAECDALIKAVEELGLGVVTATLHQMVHAFTDTEQPLERLLKAAAAAPPASPSLQLLTASFRSHARGMLRVAALTAASCPRADHCQAIQGSVKRLKRLSQELLAALGSDPESPALSHRLRLLRRHWLHEAAGLLAALDAAIDVRHFIELSIQEIVADKEECEKTAGHPNLSRSVQKLTARAQRVAQAAERCVDKSAEPVFRNGLLALVRESQRAIPPVQAAAGRCLGRPANAKLRGDLFQRIQQLIDLMYQVRDGVDGINHPDLLSPLRDHARKHQALEETSCLSNLDFSLIHTMDLKKQKLAIASESLDNYLSKPLPPHDPTEEGFKSVKETRSGLSAQFPLLVKDLISAANAKDIPAVNGACADILELSNSYMDAAREAATSTDPLEEKGRLESLKGEVAGLTPHLLSLAREVALNRQQDMGRLHRAATAWWDKISDLRAILQRLATPWYAAIKQIVCNLSANNLSQDLQSTEDITEIMASLSNCVQSAGEVTRAADGAEGFGLLGARGQLVQVHSRLKVAQNNSKILRDNIVCATKESPLFNKGGDTLEGACLLWAVSIRMLLSSLDGFLHNEIFLVTDLRDATEHKRPLQTALLAVSEKLLGLQQAATMSCVCCKEKGVQVKLCRVNDEMKVLGEALIQAAETLHQSPVNKSNLSVRFQLLQRQLAIKVKAVTSLMDLVNHNCAWALKQLFHLANSAAQKHGDGKVRLVQQFQKEAHLLLMDIEELKAVVENSLCNVTHLESKEMLVSAVTDLPLVTSQIVTEAKQLSDNADKNNVAKLQYLARDWCAKVHFIVTQLQDVGVNDQTCKDIKQRFQNSALADIKCNSLAKSLSNQEEQLTERTLIATENLPHRGNLNVLNEPTVSTVREDYHKTSDRHYKSTPEGVCSQDIALDKFASSSLHEFSSSSAACSIATAALCLRDETEKWHEDNNKIVQITKDMAAQMYHMAQFLKKQGPIKLPYSHSFSLWRSDEPPLSNCSRWDD
uniref:vinculin isoform X2 n=1 Tax=Pristiophorus japonicus TaxID=55135 RepID=UPI00398F344D